MPARLAIVLPFVSPAHGPVFGQRVQLGLTHIALGFSVDLPIVASAAQRHHAVFSHARRRSPDEPRLPLQRTRRRHRAGSKQQVLPDFFIGAHAAVEGWPLLTRDASRFRTYFPTLEVIAP
jgi:predicted nucleic acid-binding protein